MNDTGPTPHFCTECGQPIHGGKFCANCGTASGVHKAVTPALAAAVAPGPPMGEEPAEPLANGTPQTTPATETIEPARPADHPRTTDRDGHPPPDRRPVTSRRVLLALAGGALVIAGVVVAVVLLSAGDSKGPDRDAAYRQKVATAFGPVLGANQQLSDALVAIRGTNPADAKVAVNRAQHATTVASGAVSAVTAPAASSALAREARQVLDRETAYVAAISAVLNHPSVAGASQLQTLASNLTSALDSAGPTVAGNAPSVGGDDRLTAWARSTSRVLRRRAASRRKAAATGSSRPTSGSVVVASPYVNGSRCGSDFFAGPNTSCAFAANVRTAYGDAGGSATVRAYSPATGQTYTMHCARSGPSVTCLGGNDASVTF
jgi:hypothetical protein